MGSCAKKTVFATRQILSTCSVLCIRFTSRHTIAGKRNTGHMSMKGGAESRIRLGGPGGGDGDTLRYAHRIHSTGLGCPCVRIL